ncbi:phage tail sheath family protein [Sphaerotilaceae bacterium SBD11-9]
MATYKTPDVYIQEFEPAAPIAGVGTSTAAFLGACLQGPLNEPTKLSHWDQFKRLFGDAPVPDMHMWYAVRGFFENGGSECFVTRVSNATYGTLTLTDSAAQPTVVVRARQPGALFPGVSVTADLGPQSVDPATARLFRPTGTIASAAINTREITLSSAADAERFRPGDRITWVGVAAADDNQIVSRVNGAVLEVGRPLSVSYAAGALGLASPAVGTDVLRLEAAAKVAPGMVLALNQTSPLRNDSKTVKSVIVESINGTLTTYRVTLRTGLTTAFDFSGSDITVSSSEFRLTVTPVAPLPPSPPPPIVYAELGMDPEHPRYYAKIINATDPYLTVRPVDPANTTSPPGNRPGTAGAVLLPNGNADTPATLTALDYNNAIDALEAIDEINLIAVPDRRDLAVQGHLIGHCELMQDRFAVLDTPPGLEPYGSANSAELHRAGLISNAGYGALYYPWLRVSDAAGTGFTLVPPSGHVIGIYARTDQSRGVHKAPAGLAANVRGAVGVERLVSAVEQGDLNLGGVNVLRVFATGGPPTVWGARTLASGQNGNANWQYVNIRRLFLYLEESIQEGLRGAVFEPNNLQLWQRLKRTLTDFLTRSWREGALFGEKADNAFYVRIDQELNPFSEQQLGRLHIEIGVRPSYPAEFIIVRIGIWDGGSEVSEG